MLFQKNIWFLIQLNILLVVSDHFAILNQTNVSFNGILYLENFNNFNQINFTHCTQLQINYYMIKIVPTKQIIIDDSLDFKNCIIHSYSNAFIIRLENLNGINLESDPFSSARFISIDDNSTPSKMIFLFNSNLDFYFRGRLIDINNCNQELLSLNRTFLHGFSFDAGSSTVSLNRPLCPLVFHKSRITFLFLSSTNSFLSRNTLSFQNISEQLEFQIDSLIGFLEIRMYHDHLDCKKLNKYIFKRITLIRIIGVIESIEESVFKSFKYHKMLNIKMLNVKRIFHQNNKWLQYLNYDTKILYKKDIQFNDIFTLIIEQSHPNHTYYDYPDKDFCYFNQFPHNKLIIPILKPILSTNFSCTLKYLLKNTKYFYEDILLRMKHVIESGYIQFYYYDLMNQKLNFNQIDLVCEWPDCKIDSIKTETNEFFFYDFDWNVLIKFTQLIFSMILNPFMAFLCLIANILLILTLSKLDNLKNYTYLKWYSYFLFIHFFTPYFKLLFVCVADFTWNNVYFNINFCINTLKKKEFQSFYIILVKIICTTFRTCSNMFYALFAFTRYLGVTETKNVWFIRFKNLPTSLVIFIVLAFSFFMNVFSYFQFSNMINENWNTNKEKIYAENYFINEYSSLVANLNDLNDYAQEMNSSKLVILQVYYFMKILFCDVFFLVFGVFIDILLLSFIKKKRLKSNLIISLSQIKRIKKKRKEKESQKRVSAIIVLNGINFVTLRAPLLFVSFYGFIFRYDSKLKKHWPNVYLYNLCRTRHLCSIVVDVAFFFYFISFFLEYFILFKLDKNFNQSFYSIFGLKKKKKITI